MTFRNVGVTPGVGDAARFDDNTQILKLEYGAEGEHFPLEEKPAVASKQDTANTSLSSIDGKLTGAATAALQTTGNTKLDTLVASLADLLAELQAKPELGATDYAPRYSRQDAGGSNQATDPDGNLAVRAQVLTDEGTFRANFANSSLAVAIGNVTISGAVVTGTFADTLDIHSGAYFKLDADGESAWTQIESIDSSTQLTLVGAYVGGSSGAASRAVMKPVTGAGAAIAVASGEATITCGTTTGAISEIVRFVDYAPMVFRARLSMTVRDANRAVFIGFRENATTARWFSRFRLDGATATTAICETGRNPTGAPSANETESTTITLPNGLNTTTKAEWRVELLSEQSIFYVNGVEVARHTRVLPQQHDEMEASVRCENATAPAASTINIDYITCKNHNKVEVGLLSDAERVVIMPAGGVSLGAVNVTANNTDFFVLDMSQVAEVCLQVSSVGGGATIAWQASNDPTFAATVSPRAVPGGGGGHATTTTAVGHWIIPRVAKYLRIRTTAYTSGTITANVVTFAQPGRAQSIDTTYNGTQAVTATGIAGAAAHDAAISGNPVRVGARALTADYTAVATGDVADLKSTLTGALVVRQDQIPENCWSYAAASGGIDNTTTAVTIKAAAAAGIRNYLKTLQIDHDVLGGTAEIAVRDGASGTVLWRGKVQTPATEERPPITFDPPLRGTAATLMEFVVLTAVTGDVLVNATGYIAP